MKLLIVSYETIYTELQSRRDTDRQTDTHREMYLENETNTYYTYI